MTLRRTFKGKGHMRDKGQIMAFFRPILLFVGVFVAVGVNFIQPDYTLAFNLVWQTSKQAAVTLAQQQHKRILLLAGRDT